MTRLDDSGKRFKTLKEAKRQMVDFIKSCGVENTERMMKWKKQSVIRLWHSYFHGNGPEYRGCCELNP